ncbi:MAG: hypothetical protein C4308_00885 [Chitinophagaceae bacterium]
MNKPYSLKQFPYFLLLLPIFFVLHGVVENFGLVPYADAVKLSVIYLGSILALVAIAWLYYRKLMNAALAVFVFAVIYFFFGSFHDSLKRLTGNSFFSSYKVVLSILLLFVILIIILLKRKNPSAKVFLFLNILFIILVAYDLLGIISKGKSLSNNNRFNKNFVRCDSCDHPDIYLIIADGYAGHQELNDLFNYDNSEFENQLRQRGFHIVPNSKSNYNFTPFSIASMLNMDWLQGLEGSNTSKKDIALCYATIKKSRANDFLQSLGYQFYNFSIFDYPGQPSVIQPTFLPGKTLPITSQTLFNRLQRDLWYHLVVDLNLSSAKNAVLYRDQKNNNKIFSLTKQIAEAKNPNPKFIYTHLVMPHYPYYFKEDGKETPQDSLTETYWQNKTAFLSYLKYSNKIFLQLIDHIILKSAKPPVIVLMGDHGFREFKDNVEKKYHFMNLNAVYLPDRNYSNFYAGMSNINQFRVLFNSLFDQKFPVLKDSTSFLRE